MMDIPVISQSRLRTLGVTQPVVASAGAGAISTESHASGPVMKREKSSGIRPPRRGEEQVDISTMARLLSRGARKP